MFVVASCFMSEDNCCEGQYSRSCACSGAGMPLSCSFLKCHSAVQNTYNFNCISRFLILAMASRIWFSCFLSTRWKDMWQLQIARLMCCTTWWVQHGSRVSRSTSFKVLQISSILTRQKPEGGWYAWKWRRRILKFWAVKSGRLCGFPLQFCLRLPGKSALFEREVGCKDPSRQSRKQERSRAWHQSFACWWCNKM